MRARRPCQVLAVGPYQFDTFGSIYAEKACSAARGSSTRFFAYLIYDFSDEANMKDSFSMHAGPPIGADEDRAVGILCVTTRQFIFL
jgi:hypothetical protein